MIARALGSLLRQDFPGTLHVILVDDGSSDGTAETARGAAAALGRSGQLSIVSAGELPSGWTGKLWALARGVDAARALGADYLLFTDADIQHGPDSLATLIGRSQGEDRDLVSHMVRLSCATSAERSLIPAFVFFFFMIYPPAWVENTRHRTAAAAGGCILLRPQALDRIGGLEAIRSQIIDDCALARAVKHSGGRIALELAADTHSLRVYGSAAEIAAMIARTAFAQLGHSYLAVLATLLGMFVTYLLPLLLLFTGETPKCLMGIAALALMSLCYLPMVRFYRLAALRCLSLPLVALFYLGAVLRSGLDHARGVGGQWKGRVQDA